MSSEIRINPHTPGVANLIHEIYLAFPHYDTIVLEPGTYRLDPHRFLFDHPEPEEVRDRIASQSIRITLRGEGDVVIQTDKLAFGLEERFTFENLRFVKDPDSKSKDFIELLHEGVSGEGTQSYYRFKQCSFDYEGAGGNLIWFREAAALEFLHFEDSEVNFNGSVAQNGGPLSEFEMPLQAPDGLSFPGALPHVLALPLPAIPLPPRDLLPLGRYRVARTPGDPTGAQSNRLFDGSQETALLSFLKSGFRISIDLHEIKFKVLLIQNGYFHNEAKWKSHRRIKYAELLVDQNKVMTLELEDKRVPQAVDLSPIQHQLNPGSRLTLRVTGIYEGSESQGLAITGLLGLPELPALPR